MEGILTKATELASDLEPWPHYFESKTREFKTVLNFYGFDGLKRILEIGCGGGFTASLLSGRAEQVTAFDLPARNPKSHSIGIDIIEELIRRLGVKNINVVGGSAEELPFPDNSFDLIFLGYVLQYVERKEAALREIYRVLNPSGAVISIVPNFVERLVVPFIKWEYIFKRLLFHVTNRKTEMADRLTESSASGFHNKRSERLQKILDDWLLLRPDGAYRSFIEEMLRHTPGSWKGLFERNGFKVMSTFSTELLPLGLFDIFGSSVRKFISDRTYRLNNALGNVPVLRDLGYSLCLVSVKG